MLIDTAPIISLLDKNQKYHQQCLETYRRIDEPLITTWCCFTEAMYFLGKLRGWKTQEVLWKFIDAEALSIHQTTSLEQMRMQNLMYQYQDTPMDITDASLVTAAESMNTANIFTLDSDFYIY